jgi:hypothetical protein
MTCRRPFLHGVLAFLLSAPAAADTLVVSPVAVQGEVAPEGGRYLLFGEIDVDPIRRVAFTASLSGGQVGIFRTSFGVLEPIVLSGDPAPPDAGNRFAVPLGVAGNSRGDLAFISTLAFPDRVGLFLRRDGVIHTLALEGTPAPGSGDRRLGGFTRVRMLDSGEVLAIADLFDAGGAFAGRVLLAHDGDLLRTVIAPGDRYGGTRAVASVLLYDINESGDVAALIEVADAEFLQAGPLTEIVLLSAGRMRTLASVNLSFSGGIDTVRNFAVSEDQVSVDPAGAASFFAATNDFVEGGFALNASGQLFDNGWLVRQRDPSPLSPTDTYRGFAAFGRSAGGLLAFHAFTGAAPGGVVAVRPPSGGGDLVAAQAGMPRPGGGFWSGFRRLEMNDRGAFVFVDFQGLIQAGVFLGRLLPPPADILADIAALLEDPSLSSSAERSLSAALRRIERTLAQGNLDRTLQAVAAMRRDVAMHAGRSIPLPLAEAIDTLLADLEQALRAQAAAN